MTTFTIIATATTDTDLATIETAVRTALDNAGAALVPCNWAPDLDTITDCVIGFPDVTLIDLNPGFDWADQVAPPSAS